MKAGTHVFVALIFLALPSAGFADDLLNVVLKVADGNVEYHLQHMTSARCEAALATFREARKAGQQYNLTLEAPPRVTGVVLDMNCIAPDGSIRGPDGPVHIPD